MHREPHLVYKEPHSQLSPGHVLFVEKRARNRPNLPGVLGSAPSAGASAGAASVAAASAAVAALRRRSNILRSLSRFRTGSAGASAGAVTAMGAVTFSSPVKTKAASPARTMHASTELASTDGGGGARALARAVKSKAPVTTPSRGSGLKSSPDAVDDFSIDFGFGFGGGGRTVLRGTTVR